MNRYSTEKDRTARPARLTQTKPQDATPLPAGVQIKYGPAPKPEKVPAIFSRTAPGINPLTAEAWE